MHIKQTIETTGSRILDTLRKGTETVRSMSKDSLVDLSKKGKDYFFDLTGKGKQFATDMTKKSKDTAVGYSKKGKEYVLDNAKKGFNASIHYCAVVVVFAMCLFSRAVAHERVQPVLSQKHVAATLAKGQTITEKWTPSIKTQLFKVDERFLRGTIAAVVDEVAALRTPKQEAQ